jgi:hypothetical protein
MPCRSLARVALPIWVTGLALIGSPVRADDSAELRAELQQLREQNAALEGQLRKQQGLIEVLSQKVNEIQQTQSKPKSESLSLDSDTSDAGRMSKDTSTFTFGKLNISGEGGVAFFRSGADGMYPKDEFRVDEARFFVEAPVMESLYFFGEVNLATREEPDVQARLGELYIDFENVSQLWQRDHVLNVRAGRMYIPFGEEYLTRYAIDNPFISHSLSDLWGVDEGIELYGRVGKISYAAAVQNGGIPDTSDFTSDKSIAGRIGFNPIPQVYLSLSGMRTGDLDVAGDQLSAIWFGSGFFRSLGSSSTTRFHANLAEMDAQWHFPHGHLGAFAGYIHYQDNDPLADNARDVYYYSLEGVHDIVGKLYGGARFSEIFANRGFPIVGNGDFGDYFFGSLTTEIWRLSLDLGYRWSQNFLLKAEYTFERGQTADGGKRNDEDLVALEAAFKF